MSRTNSPLPMFFRSVPPPEYETVLLIHAQNNLRDESLPNKTINVLDIPTINLTGGNLKFGTTFKGVVDNASLSTPDGASFAMGTGDFTIDMWLAPWEIGPTTATERCIWDNVTSTNDVNGGYLYINTSGNLCWKNGATEHATSGTMTASTWQHVAVSREGTTMRLFINGVKQAEFSNSQNLTNTKNVFFKSNVHSKFIKTWFQEIRIVKGAALYTANFDVPTEPYVAEGTPIAVDASVLFHFEGSNGATTAKDWSYMQNTSTFVGGASISTTKYKFSGEYPTSCYFDGVDGCVKMDKYFGFTPGSFTIDMWINFSSLPASNLAIGHYWRASGDNWGFDLTADRELRFFTRTGYGALQEAKSEALTLSTDTWYHIAYVRSGNTMYFFLDGVAKGTASWNPGVYDWTTYADFYIGKTYDTSTWTPYYLDGYIDEFRYMRNTPAWTSGFTPATVEYEGHL